MKRWLLMSRMKCRKLGMAELSRTVESFNSGEQGMNENGYLTEAVNL